MKPKYFTFPIGRGIRSFPLPFQLCLTDPMERYSSSLWPDLFTTQIPLCAPYAQTTGSAQDHPDQCKSSLLSKIEARTPEPDWEEGQHFRKLEIQKKKSRVLQEVCLLSSPLNYVIWKPLVSMSWGQKWKAELPVFKGGTFYRKKAWSLARTPTSHEEAFVQRPLLQAQLYYFWKRRGRRLDFGASGKVIANKPSNCSVKIWQVQN